MATRTGYPSENKDSRVTVEPTTVNRVGQYRFGEDINAHVFKERVGTDAAEADSTEYEIVATAHQAVIGDVIKFTSGSNAGVEATVIKVDTNLITLAQTLKSIITPGDAFRILRPTSPEVDSSGFLKVTDPAASGTINYQLELDDVGGGVSYVGQADPGSASSSAVWRIRRITETGDDISVKYADSNDSFDNIWDNRLSLSY